MDYQGNSHKAKEDGAEKPEKKKVEKVITGEAVVKQPGFGRKFKTVFFGGDFKAAVSFVVADIVLPSVRNMMADASKGAIDRVIYGETSFQRRRSSSDYRPRVNYQNPLSRIAVDPRLGPSGRLPDQPPIPMRRDTLGGSELILPTREEALLVLDRLADIVDQYDSASLADLYDLVGMPSQHTDNKWGWTYVKNAEVAQVRDGFLLKLPPMESL